jgi:hypothetical protein
MKYIARYRPKKVNPFAPNPNVEIVKIEAELNDEQAKHRIKMARQAAPAGFELIEVIKAKEK